MDLVVEPGLFALQPFAAQSDALLDERNGGIVELAVHVVLIEIEGHEQPERSVHQRANGEPAALREPGDGEGGLEPEAAATVTDMNLELDDLDDFGSELELYGFDDVDEGDGDDKKDGED